MFEEDGEGGVTVMHHPFTAPKDFTPEQLESRSALAATRTLMTWLSTATKWVVVQCVFTVMTCNRRYFRAIGISEAEQREIRFPARCVLKFGTPPHAGLVLVSIV